MTVEKKDNHCDSEEVLYKRCQSSDAALNDFIEYMFYYGEPNNRIDNHYNEVLSKLAHSSNSSDKTIVGEKDSKINKEKEDEISVWLQAAKEELEKEQENGLEPLNKDEESWELEKEKAVERLRRIKKDLEEYRKLCGEEAKEFAPKFGLG